MSACKNEDDCPTPMWCRGKDKCRKAKSEQALGMLRNEILAVMWRFSKESDVTILDTIKAAHQSAERIAEIALDAKST